MTLPARMGRGSERRDRWGAEALYCSRDGADRGPNEDDLEIRTMANHRGRSDESDRVYAI
jgi:hypothetical protein